MDNKFSKLRALIIVMAMVVLAVLPESVSADTGEVNKIFFDDYSWYILSFDELGAGATPLTGEISVPEYHAREVIMWSSPVSLDLNLKPIGLVPLIDVSNR